MVPTVSYEQSMLESEIYNQGSLLQYFHFDLLDSVVMFTDNDQIVMV